MKKIIALLCMIFVMANTAYASELTWETAPGHHGQSVLLEAEVQYSEDIVHRYGKGEYLSTGRKYSLQGTTQGRYLTGGVPPVRFSM